MKISAFAAAALALLATTSIAAAQAPFTSYTPPDGKFTVMFPGSPTVGAPHVEKTTSGISYNEQLYAVSEGNSAAYLLMTIDYDPSANLVHDWNTLAAGANTCGGTVSVRNTDTYQGHPAALIQVNCPATTDLPPTVALDRAVFNGNRLYQILYIAPTVDPDRSSTFLNSLHIN